MNTIVVTVFATLSVLLLGSQTVLSDSKEDEKDIEDLQKLLAYISENLPEEVKTTINRNTQLIKAFEVIKMAHELIGKLQNGKAEKEDKDKLNKAIKDLTNGVMGVEKEEDDLEKKAKELENDATKLEKDLEGK